MNFRPIEDVIIVDPHYDHERYSPGGIFIPPTVENDAIVTGIVLAVGPGKVNLKTGKLMPVTAKVGQTIYYHISSAVELKEDRKKYHFIDETVAVAISD